MLANRLPNLPAPLDSALAAYLTRIMPSKAFTAIAKGSRLTRLAKKAKRWVERSAYAQRLWKAACLFLLREHTLHRTATIFAVDFSDLSHIIWCLNEEKLVGKLRYKFPLSRTRLAPISFRRMEVLLAKLSPFIRKLVWRKTLFLFNYDTGLSKEDLESELTQEAVYLIRYYEHYRNELFLLNTVKRGIRNKVMNLISFHTAKCRSRLVKVDNDERVYQTTTISLSQDEKDRGIGGICELSTGKGEELTSLANKVAPKYRRFMEIVLGVDNNGFDDWLEKNYSNPHTLKYEAVGRAAMNYLGLKPERVQRVLGRPISRMLA